MRADLRAVTGGYDDALDWDWPEHSLDTFDPVGVVVECSLRLPTDLIAAVPQPYAKPPAPVGDTTAATKRRRLGSQTIGRLRDLPVDGVVEPVGQMDVEAEIVRPDTERRLLMVEYGRPFFTHRRSGLFYGTGCRSAAVDSRRPSATSSSSLPFE